MQHREWSQAKGVVAYRAHFHVNVILSFSGDGANEARLKGINGRPTVGMSIAAGHLS
jgi:hypothetical protein